MEISDEKLMAFADGELTGPEAEAVAAAVAADPVLAGKVEQHRALRMMLSGAFDPVLDEPLPQGLAALARPTPVDPVHVGNVADLAAEREKRNARRQTFVQRWGAIAAALVVGVLAGQLGDFGGGLVKERNGVLIARTSLASALDDQLASEDPTARGSPIRVGLTFRDQADHYCRTFAAVRADGLSGIACRESGQWQVRMAAPASPEQGAGYYRMAGSDEAILMAAQAMMKGAPLDAAAEARARAQAWQDGR